jgi:hypothetical protein
MEINETNDRMDKVFTVEALRMHAVRLLLISSQHNRKAKNWLHKIERHFFIAVIFRAWVGSVAESTHDADFSDVTSLGEIPYKVGTYSEIELYLIKVSATEP